MKKKAYFCTRYFGIRTMNKVVWGCCLLGLMASCAGEKKKTVPLEELTEQMDSVQPTVTDTVPAVEEWVKEEPVPVTADESFADFFYNFASDEPFQRARIVFPISYYKGEEVVRTTQEDWTFDPLFSGYPAYTVLFDNEEDMEMEKDTAVHSVQIDWMYLTDRKIKRYYFERIDQAWYLEAINKENMPEPESDADLLASVYQRVSTDPAFQQLRLNDPLTFITADPEDEFQIIETTLDAGQWSAFRPPMVQGWLSNVHYGQPEASASSRKIVEFKGFGNGFNNALYFERHRGEWKLMKFEDLSD